MRGQKRVEDARERADDPRIHPLRENFLRRSMDCRLRPGNDGMDGYSKYNRQASRNDRSLFSIGPINDFIVFH